MAPKRQEGAAGQTGLEIDPVCGMELRKGKALGPIVLAGRAYWFCSTPCRDRFVTDPDRYLLGQPRGLPAERTGNA